MRIATPSRPAIRLRIALRANRAVLIVGIVTVAAVAASTLLHSPAASAPPDADPVAIHRVVLPPNKLAGELERLGRPALVQLSRDEFESLVQQAARVSAGAQRPPRLIEARYSATWTPGGLLGAGQWQITHDGPGPGRLSLATLQIAIRSANWQNNEEALLGFLDDRPNAPLELLVEKSGTNTLTLDWTARSVVDPNGERIDLRLPASAIASMDLELPDDLQLQANRESYLVAGPTASTKPGWKKWQLSFGGRAAPGQGLPVTLVLKRTQPNHEPAPLIRPYYETNQRLVPGHVECEFDIDMIVHRDEVRELLLEGDPGLRIHEVSAPSVESWQIARSPERVILSIRLREGFSGGRLVIRAQAPLPDAQSLWRSPALRVRGGTSRGERLSLRLHPELQIGEWSAGSFRLLAAQSGADQFYEVALHDTLAAASVRPQARIMPAGAVFDVRQTNDWLLQPGQMSLSVDFRVSVERGAVTQLPLAMPVGWELDRIEAEPTDLGFRWSLEPAGPGRTRLVLEPSKPLGPSDIGRWTIHLRAPLRLPFESSDNSVLAAFPDVAPIGARRRDGTLAVRVDPALSARLVEMPPASARGRPRVIPDEGGKKPEFSFALTESAMEGSLRVGRREGRITGRCEGEFAIAAGQVRFTQRLQLTHSGGPVSEVILFCPTALPEDVEWRVPGNTVDIQRMDTSEIRHASAAMATLSASSAMDSLPLLRWTGRRQGSWYRLRFDRALASSTSLEASGKLPATEPRVSLPVLALADVEQFTGQATIRCNPTSIWVPAMDNSPKVRTAAQEPGKLVLRYGSEPFSLALERRQAPVDAARCQHAALLVLMTENGRQLRQFSASITGWTQSYLPVCLPSGAQLIHARVDGHDVVAVETSADERGITIHLPWLPGSTPCDVDLLYEERSKKGTWIFEIQAQAPMLPVAMVVRRTWRLPAQVTPVWQCRLRRLPGNWNGRIRFDRVIGNQTDLGKTDDRIDSALRAAKNATTLGEALHRMAVDLKRSGVVLIVDAAALTAEGWSPSRSMPDAANAHNWLNSLGLMVVTGPSPPLVTTTAMGTSWNGALPGSVEEAVTEAAQSDRDHSGRFVTVAGWLTDGSSPSTPQPIRELESLIGWESCSGFEIERLRVAPTALITWLGIVMAAFTLLGVARIVVTGWRSRWTLVLMLAALSALAWIWLPPNFEEIAGWSLAGCVLGGSAALFRRKRRSPPPLVRNHHVPTTNRASGAGIVVLAVLGAVIGLPATAAGPAPARVYLVRDDDKSERVLAPPDLLEQLRGIIRQRHPSAEGVLIRARYEGSCHDDHAVFDAHFVVLCPHDRPGIFALPLAGVQLQEARVNASPAFPRAVGERYLFDLPGAGKHTLSVRFSAPISGATERQVRFTNPELATSTLVFRAPKGSTFLQPLSFRGAMQIEELASGPKLHVDLGRVTTVVLHWKQPGPEPLPQKPAVQELFLWDIQEATSRLQAAYRIRLGNDFIRALEFDVPRQLEVAQVQVRAVDERASAGGVVAVRDWRIRETAGSQRLTVELSGPVNGQIQGWLELVPRKPFDMHPHLVFSTYVGNVERESYIAVRVQGWEADLTEVRGLVRTSEELFFREQWQPLRVDSAAKGPQFAFQRMRSEVSLRVALKSPATKTIAEQTIDWTVGPGRAAVSAEARWYEPSTPGYVEWDVSPDVIITLVRGEGLRHWSRRGARLQAWFERDLRTSGDPTALLLLGWVNRPQDAAAHEKLPFVAPEIGFPTVAAQTTKLRIRPMSGWRLDVVHDGPYQSMPDADLPGFIWTGIASQSGSATVRLLREGGGVAESVVVHKAELSGRTLSFVNQVTLESQPGLVADRPNSIWVDVHHTDATRLSLELSPGARLRETATAPGRTSWNIDLGSDKTTLTVSSRRTLLFPQELDVPLVHVRGAIRQVRHLLLRSPDLRPIESAGLDRAESREPEVAVWRIAPEVRSMRLQYAPGLGRTTGAQGVFTRATAAVDADGRWVVDAHFVVATYSETELTARLPYGAEGIAASIDGKARMLGAHGLYAFVAPGIHDVHVVWRSAATLSGRNPHLMTPTFQGISTAPVFWRVLAPPGYRIHSVIPSQTLADQDLAVALQWDRAILIHAGQAATEMRQAAHRRREAALQLAEHRAAESPDRRLQELRERVGPPSSSVEWDASSPNPPLRGRLAWLGQANGPSMEFEVVEQLPVSKERLALTAMIVLGLAIGFILTLRRPQV